MSFILGAIMVLGSIALGIYVGLYLCFLKGVLKLIELFKRFFKDESDTLEAKHFVVPVLKVWLGGAAGGAIVIFLGLPGLMMMLHSVLRG